MKFAWALQIPIVILSESLAAEAENGNLRKGHRVISEAAEAALSRGVHLAGAASYFETWWAKEPRVSSLFDSILAAEDEAGGEGEGGQVGIFPPHLSGEALAEERARGAVVEGVLSVVSLAKREAVVHLKGHGGQVKTSPSSSADPPPSELLHLYLAVSAVLIVGLITFPNRRSLPTGPRNTIDRPHGPQPLPPRGHRCCQASALEPGGLFCSPGRVLGGAR